MAIINRTLDSSEQKELVSYAGSPLNVNQQDIPLMVVPRAATISDCKVAMNGVSGAPNILLKVLRFVAGTGGSSFLVGSTFAVTTFATSGFLSYSLPAAGSTTLLLQKGDVLMAVQGGGTGAASTQTIIDVVVSYAQDIKTWY